MNAQIPAWQAYRQSRQAKPDPPPHTTKDDLWRTALANAIQQAITQLGPAAYTTWLDAYLIETNHTTDTIPFNTLTFALRSLLDNKNTP
jgi:hypothetical protein